MLEDTAPSDITPALSSAIDVNDSSPASNGKKLRVPMMRDSGNYEFVELPPEEPKLNTEKVLKSTNKDLLGLAQRLQKMRDSDISDSEPRTEVKSSSS